MWRRAIIEQASAEPKTCLNYFRLWRNHRLSLKLETHNLWKRDCEKWGRIKRDCVKWGRIWTIELKQVKESFSRIYWETRKIKRLPLFLGFLYHWTVLVNKCVHQTLACFLQDLNFGSHLVAKSIMDWVKLRRRTSQYFPTLQALLIFT